MAKKKQKIQVKYIIDKISAYIFIIYGIITLIILYKMGWTMDSSRMMHAFGHTAMWAILGGFVGLGLIEKNKYRGVKNV